MATSGRHRPHETTNRYACQFEQAFVDSCGAECFYNREGLWYYAGSYQAFQLEDLTLKEWAELPTEVWKWYKASLLH